MPAKFKAGQRVKITGGTQGSVLHAFLFKVYGQPDAWHYTVRVSPSLVTECDETELSL